MKKQLLVIIVLFISRLALCQTAVQSFECRMQAGYWGFTQSEIVKYVSKLNLENYRLQDQQTTLTFTNGFDIILFSAKEMVKLNLINDASGYPTAFPKDYLLPTINMAPDGRIVTIYKPNNKKFKRGE